MKWILSVAACLLAVNVVPTSAQLIRSYGLHAGAVVATQEWNYSAISSFKGLDTKSLWGFSGGAFVELLNVPYISVLAAFDYTQKGRVVTVTETDLANNPQGYIDLGPRDHSLRFHYIGAAALAKMRLETPSVTPFVAVGPRIDYLIAHPKSPVYNGFKKTEFSLTLAGGAEIPLGFIPARLLLEARYSPGMTAAYQNELVTVKNRHVEILAGVSF